MNDYEKKRGHPCDSQEWFFKILGAPEYKHAWCAKKEEEMSKAPTICMYCDGEGNSSAGGRCGFCENGKPLDTQSDWDNSWGRVESFAEKMREEIILSDGDQQKIADLLKKKENDEER